MPLQLFNGQYQIDNCDESQNREETDGVVDELSQRNGGVIKLTSIHPVTSDTIDESKSQQQRQNIEEECDVNMVMVDLTQSEIDSIDESGNRLNNVTLTGSTEKAETQVKSDSVCDQNDINTSATSRSRVYKSTLDVMFNSKQELFKVTDEGMEATEQEGAEQIWSSGPIVCDPDEESRSRQARCVMSIYHQKQQPVTPVVQSGSIDATVVNKQDVDKCLVTNKYTSGKQDSISVSNQWLYNAFSKITFGIWDKSKNNAGEGVVENVNTNSKTKLTLKPEFNFPL